MDDITGMLADFAKAANWEHYLVDKKIGPKLTSGFIIRKLDGTIEIYDPFRRGIKRRYDQGMHNPGFFDGVDERVKGIIINLHPECESFEITWNVSRGRKAYLASYIQLPPGDLWDEIHCFTKTQYAPLWCHVTICKLLRFLQNHFGVKLRVDDEGEYYKTGDLDKLAEKMGDNLAAIKETAELLEKIFKGTGYKVITNF